MLFGTDWPVIDPERAVREVAELGLRPEAHRALMRDNALCLFKLPGRPSERRGAAKAASAVNAAAAPAAATKVRRK